MVKNKNKRDILSYLQPYPGCPSLAWMIAKRVTDPMIELDCTIMVTGPKGVGKSTFCVALAYEVAKAITIIRHKKKLRSLSGNDRKAKVNMYIDKIFNMEHIKSVDKEGTLEMFSGDIIQVENSVLICDDISIAANSRNSMTNNNKALTQIMTVSRPFRNVIIMNSVYSSLIDKSARGFADILIEMVGIDKKNKRSIAKAFLYEVNQTTGKEYKKFFTFNGMRIKYWISYLPPKYLRKAYKKLRMDKTRELLNNFQEEQEERKNKGTKRTKKSDEIINTYKDQILEMDAKGESMRAMTRVSPDLSIHYVNKILALKNTGVK
jgi:nucleoside-triphosphatase THEP1